MRIRSLAGLVSTGSMLVVTALAVAQDGPPSGTVRIESKSVAIGIGVSWGDGQPSYEGKTYPFSVKGLSVVDLGVSKVTATGEVFNLKKVSDFSGNFAAGQAGATVGGGADIAVMKNQNGVVMKLKGTGQGVQLTLAAKGLDVQLKQ